MIDISVVIITWNIRDLVCRCIETVYQFTSGVSFEVILVDNGSVDDTKEQIRLKFPDVKLIENIRNAGVGPARNQGMRIAQGNYILILDADTELVENSLLKMFKFMEGHPDVALVGCKLVDGEGNLQYTSRRFPTIQSILARRLDFIPAVGKSSSLRFHMMEDVDHNSNIEVDYVIGACQFIRKDDIAQTGLYDENIFYGPEDLDLCLRIWRRGKKVYYFSETKIYHKEQRITKRNPFSVISLKHIVALLYIFNKYKGKLTRVP